MTDHHNLNDHILTTNGRNNIIFM